MVRLWRNTDEAPEGKYLVMRRDGTVPEWPCLVIGGADPAGPAALRAYADDAEERGYDPDMVADVRDLATEFERWRAEHGDGDPDAPRHRQDHPAVIGMMRQGRMS